MSVESFEEPPHFLNSTQSSRISIIENLRHTQNTDGIYFHNIVEEDSDDLT